MQVRSFVADLEAGCTVVEAAEKLLLALTLKPIAVRTALIALLPMEQLLQGMHKQLACG